MGKVTASIIYSWALHTFSDSAVPPRQKLLVVEKGNPRGKDGMELSRCVQLQQHEITCTISIPESLLLPQTGPFPCGLSEVCKEILQGLGQVLLLQLRQLVTPHTSSRASVAALRREFSDVRKGSFQVWCPHRRGKEVMEKRALEGGCLKFVV